MAPSPCRLGACKQFKAHLYANTKPLRSDGLEGSDSNFPTYRPLHVFQTSTSEVANKASSANIPRPSQAMVLEHIGTEATLIGLHVYRENLRLRLPLGLCRKPQAPRGALMDKNRRLCDNTHVVLSSPSFSIFLNHLGSNPSALPQTAQVKVERQSQEQAQILQDVNPYSAQSQQQHIGMAMVPEQTMNFSLLSLHCTSNNSHPKAFVANPLEFVEEASQRGDDKVEVHPIKCRTEMRKAAEPVEVCQTIGSTGTTVGILLIDENYLKELIHRTFATTIGRGSHRHKTGSLCDTKLRPVLKFWRRQLNPQLARQARSVSTRFTMTSLSRVPDTSHTTRHRSNSISLNDDAKPKVFDEQGAIGKHFTEQGAVGGTAQKLGGAFDKEGALGKQFTSEGAIGGRVQTTMGGEKDRGG
ncbi:hypothetical protein Purlil1_12316 [Purpureocillium lilacinum]|uniref:Uncharacterized protein n=1 Tax=Purpureocillium lilacinum TaxID=33203 RepID=A0ABR0BH56_PURLI|nr:hypothetical protein Purlil1_12316 [Purpureocillium lilacinum]